MENKEEVPYWVIEDLLWSEKVLNSDACYDSIREAQKMKNICLNELQIIQAEVEYSKEK